MDLQLDEISLEEARASQSIVILTEMSSQFKKLFKSPEEIMNRNKFPMQQKTNIATELLFIFLGSLESSNNGK